MTLMVEAAAWAAEAAWEAGRATAEIGGAWAAGDSERSWQAAELRRVCAEIEARAESIVDSEASA